MSESVAPADPGLASIERLCWHLSGWNVEQRDVDRLLAEIQVYAAGAGSSGAAAPLASGGEGAEMAPDAPLSAAEAPTGPVEPSGPVEEAQAPVQHVHVTGTLTLVCPGGHAPAAQPASHKRQAPRTRRRVPAAQRRRQPASPDTHDPTQPEDYRTCRQCQESKAIGEFVRDVHGRRGRKTVCRDCENTRKRTARRAKKQTAA
jgi:hypothetical protein